MKRYTATGPVLFTSVFFLVAASCAPKPLSVRALRIRSEIPGWAEEKKTFVFFSPKTLFDLIDGGAPEYIDNGLREGFFQRLIGPDSARLDVYADDFGSIENARAMFACKRRPPDTSGLSSGTDTSALSLAPVIGGLWACGIVNRFYFEFTLLTGGDRAKAKTTIGRLFGWYREKIARDVAREGKGGSR